MSQPDASAKSGIVNGVSNASEERSLDSIDPNALVTTFRSDAANESIQKLIRREMEVQDLPISKELEAMRTESHNAHLSSKFETNREQEQSKCIASSVNAWIDTALDSLNIVAHTSAMISLLADVLKKHEVQSIPLAALEIGRSLLDRTLAIYSRSIRQAFAGTNLLLCEIDENDNTKNNPGVKKAIENYERSWSRYNNSDVHIKEVVKSHSQLVQKVKDAKPDETTGVRQEAKKSSMLWNIVLIIGVVIAVPLVVGGLVLCGIMMSKK